MVPALILLGAVVVFGAGYFTHRFSAKRSDKVDKEALASYRNTYLLKQGWALGHGQYYLLSIDGGAIWYAVERASKSRPGLIGPFNIVGKAEMKFPGLIAELEGMDALLKHVRKSGPLTLTGEGADEEISLATSAGFTVRHGGLNRN